MTKQVVRLQSKKIFLALAREGGSPGFKTGRQIAWSGFENARFAKFRCDFGRARFEPGATKGPNTSSQAGHLVHQWQSLHGTQFSVRGHRLGSSPVAQPEDEA
jgi:hypothetical protein